MEKLGNFRILEPIGAGGMGEVFRARDHRLQRDIAIKILSPKAAGDPKGRARLLREARLAAALSHPHICVVHDVGETEEGQAWIAMECIPGEPLSERLARGPLPPSEVVRYGLQLTDALAHAHERGVVHRDLKPGNIIVTPENRLKVLDFGLARRDPAVERLDSAMSTESRLTVPGSISGTPAYMSPEQLRGDPTDHRTDIWAVGIILHEMATAERPFAGRTLAALSSSILNDTPDPMAAGVAPGLAAIITRCLAKDPAQRYRHVSEVAAALESTTASGSIPMRGARRLPPGIWWLAGAAAVLVLVIAIAMMRSGRVDTPEPPAIEALAVLPLANLSGDPEQEYLVAGMHDALVGELARIKALRVISRSSVLPYRNKPKKLVEVGRELNVGAVVEGAVTRAGDRVRVQVQLVNVRGDERLLFSRSYERSIEESLQLNGEIARELARAMQVAVTPAEQAGLMRSRTGTREAYEAYLRALHSLNKMTPESFQKALGYLHEAVDRDPADPVLYSGLAFVYSQRAHGPGDPREDFPLAKAAAERALRLDETLSDPRHTLARIRLYWDWELDAAGEDLRRAIELNPNLAAAHADYSWWLVLARRYDEAIAQMNRAQAIDPLEPTWPTWQAWIHLWNTGNFAEGERQARRALSMNPEFSLGWCLLAWTQAAMQQHAAAIESAQRAAQNPSFRFGLGLVHAMSGDAAEARLVAAELAKKPSPMDVWMLAEIYGALGDRAAAIQWLERAHAMRFSYIPWILETPSFHSLRGEPRFEAMVRDLGVPLRADRRQ
jgi:serine/threonine-protein kinase